MKRKSMSKNLTRKGLAFGALVALGASVFAGAPAYAADTVVLAANYTTDKTLAAPVTEALTLNASLAPGSTAANITQLKYKIVTDATYIAKLTASSGGSTTPVVTYTRTDSTTNPVGVADVFTAGNAANDVKTTTYLTPTGTPDAANINRLSIQVAAINAATLATPGTAGTGAAPEKTTATKTAVVTAFIDSNLNSILDAGEASQEQTVTFRKFSEITTTTTVSPVTQGDTTVTATVKFTNVNNEALQQAAVATNVQPSNGLAAHVGAFFTKGDGTDLTPDLPSITGITSIAAAGTTATVTTAAAHGIGVGDTVIVAGSGTAAFNGTFTVLATATSTTFTYTVASTTATSTTAGMSVKRSALASTTVTGNGTTAVYTVTGTNSYAVGDVVTIAGNSTAGFNGTFTITAVSAATAAATITVANTTAAATVASAMTITRVRDTAAVVQKNVTWTSTNDGFKFTTGTIGALAKSTAVKVQPLLNDSAAALTGASVAKTVGTAQTASVATRVLGSLVGNTVKSTTAAAGTEGTAATATAAQNTEKQVYFLAKDTATTAKAVAGQAVAVAVTTSVTLSSTITLTVNGTTYTSNAALPGATGVAKLALTSDAKGKVFVTYKTVGYGTQNVAFTATAENFSASVTVTEAVRDFVTGNTTYISNHEGDTAVTTDGTAVSVQVVVQDQFGGSPADGGYTVTATASAQGQATPGTSTAGNTNSPVVAGKATLSILDGGTGLGNNVYAIALQSTAANGVLTSVKTIAASFTIKVVAAADVAAGEVVLSGTGISASATTGIYGVAAGTGANSGASDGTGALTYSDFANVDGRAIAVTAPLNTNLADGSVTAVQFSGTVNSASTSTYGGVAVPGASVTVSAAGLQFAVTQDGSAIYGADSLTFVANATGTFTVSVWSHKAGKQTVTVKSGTGSASIELYFAVAAEAAASKVTVVVADGAAQFQAGRALDVTFTVTDVLGNPVALNQTTDSAKLTIAQTGSGYLTLSGDQATGTTGKFASKLITNAGDLGTSTITATVDFSDTTVTDLVATNSSEFGVTDADVTVGGRAVYASVEFAKGKTVTVSVDGKRLYSKLFSTDAYTELKFTQKKAGKHVVTVRVSGGIVYSETVTTTK
jgi:hypothetical protein